MDGRIIRLKGAIALLHARSRRFLPMLMASLVWILSGQAAAQQLDNQLQRLIQGANLGTTKLGVIVMDPESGTVLAEHGAHEELIPASNMKLMTSGAALHTLGTEFTFRTELIVAADPQTGGSMVLVRGDGDPAFGDPELLEQMGLSPERFVDAWVASLKRSDLREPIGLVIDDRIFDRQFVHPTWPAGQLNRWYCAEVAGLTFHTNIINLFVQPNKSGTAPTVRMDPNATWIDVRNRAKSTDKGKQTVWAAREFNTNSMTLFGDVRWANEPVRVTLHDNAAFFGKYLAERMEAGGIKPSSVRLAGPDEGLPSGETVHLVQTHLPTVLARCNKDSQNLYAECLFKRIGHEVSGAPGSWKNGAAVLRMVLLERIGPSSARAISIADGSGMSRENRLTPHLMAQWLTSFVQDEKLWPLFLESLPSAGEEGTLSKRFREQRPGHSVRAKSGYLNGVSALSGYVIDDASGRTVVFSIITNDKPAKVPLRRIRDLEEQIVLAVDDWLTEEVASPNFGG